MRNFLFGIFTALLICALVAFILKEKKVYDVVSPDEIDAKMDSVANEVKMREMYRYDSIQLIRERDTIMEIEINEINKRHEKIRSNNLDFRVLDSVAGTVDTRGRKKYN